MYKGHSSPGMRDFTILWATQTLSALGSAMTSFALVLWSYGQSGSAVVTALLSVSSYAPYVLMSLFAGALRQPALAAPGRLPRLHVPGGTPRLHVGRTRPRAKEEASARCGGFFQVALSLRLLRNVQNGQKLM